MHQFNTNSLIHNCLSDYLCLHGIRACLLKSNSYQTSVFQPSENPAEFNENPATQLSENQQYVLLSNRSSKRRLFISPPRPLNSERKTDPTPLFRPTLRRPTRRRPPPRAAREPAPATGKSWSLVQWDRIAPLLHFGWFHLRKLIW